MNVFIVGRDSLIEQMYRDEGSFTMTSELSEADLVQFTGGSDVSPAYYHCKQHPTTSCNPSRDEEEAAIWEKCMEREVPMVGICRGGQFLNVMAGGRMFQHVDGHAIGGVHLAEDKRTGYSVKVTSTHHQMMIPSRNTDCEILLSVKASLCSRKEYTDGEGITYVVSNSQDIGEDIESLFYPEYGTLCFQPHPEYAAGVGCREYFFALIDRYLFNDDCKYETWKDVTYSKLLEDVRKDKFVKDGGL